MQVRHQSSYCATPDTDHKCTASQNRALKVAVEDFEVRSSYTFWMDITVKEASHMRVALSQEDLVCSFKLDIPNLQAVIESDQFYILLNVVRNVMLSPPPATAASNRAKAEQEAREGGKRKEIVRSRELMQRYDLKMPSVLDINNKASRDEIRVLVEEATKQPLETERGIARFVECFIGKGKW